MTTATKYVELRICITRSEAAELERIDELNRAMAELPALVSRNEQEQAQWNALFDEKQQLQQQLGFVMLSRIKTAHREYTTSPAP